MARILAASRATVKSNSENGLLRRLAKFSTPTVFDAESGVWDSSGIPVDSTLVVIRIGVQMIDLKGLSPSS